jgi:3-oxoacyl-[acyl-carrier protein] reductase
MGRLTGKIAVVTGASKGIGAATAKLLALEGASVVVNYKTSKVQADGVVDDIQKSGGTAIAVGADVTDEAAVASLFEQTKSAYGRVDVLINNAGTYKFEPIQEVSAAQFAREFDLNVLGLLLVTKAALPLFPESGGSIVNVSSVVSTLAPPGSAVSGGSKAAVDTISKALAKELGPRGIRVNAINAGVTMTEGLVAAGLVGGEFERHAIATTPLGRIAQPLDIALPIVFLATEDARWITGETIITTGGQGI